MEDSSMKFYVNEYNPSSTCYDVVCEINGIEKIIGTCTTKADAMTLCSTALNKYRFAKCIANIYLPKATFMIRERHSIF